MKSNLAALEAKRCLVELEGYLNTIINKDSGTHAVLKACMAGKELDRCLLRLRQINARVLTDDYPRYEQELKSRIEKRGANEKHTKGSG